MRSQADFFAKLELAVERNQSLLCVGLDPQPAHLPERYRIAGGDMITALETWNRAIIDATADLACVYKPNIAFYEALGAAGQVLLRDTLAYIPDNIPVLLDAKRGDIGMTARAYAQACFEQWQVDAVTISPYLGEDSIEPFLRYPGKGLFVLCHTSNVGSGDFQELEVADRRTLDREPNQPLYIHVARKAIAWGDQIGLVVGATYPAAVENIKIGCAGPMVFGARCRRTGRRTGRRAYCRSTSRWQGPIHQRRARHQPGFGPSSGGTPSTRSNQPNSRRIAYTCNTYEYCR